MAREYLMLAVENAAGVPASGEPIQIKLSQSNAFTMSAAPVIGELGLGNGISTTGCFYSSQKQVTGTLQGELYPAYAPTLLNWGITPVNDDRDEPWVTVPNSGIPVGDLASATIYHAFLPDDSETFKCYKYPGVKVAGGSITAGSNQLVWNYSLNLQGTQVVSMSADDFPFPDTEAGVCDPYVWADLAGNLKIGTTRADYSTVTFSWQNTLATQYFESSYPKRVRYTGRGNGTTLAVNLLLKTSPDDEAAYQALTKQDVELTLDNGTHTLKIDLNTNNVWSQRTRDLAIDGFYLLNMTLRNAFDTTAGADIVVTST